MIIRLFCYIIFILCPLFTYATDQLSKRIHHVLEENNSIARRLNIAIQINDLNTGEEIYTLNPYASMTPASTLKSFTAYAALEYLKPTFTYTTQISFDKDKIHHALLSDNLYIRFTGDPSLTKDEFAQLIAGLHSFNIKKILGDIIIDDTIFDQNYQAQGWSWDDNKFCFAAPTSAIVIDKNCFKLNLSINNNLAKLTDINNVFAQINNELSTKEDPTCIPDLVAYHDNRYNLTGCFDIKSPSIPLNIAYQNPRMMIAALVKQLLEQQHIQFQGKILFNSALFQYPVMLEHKSNTLDILVKDMLKSSDNIAADNFLKTIGAYYYKTQGTFVNGTKAIAEILTKTGIDFEQTRIFDGSGGSRYNLIAANQLVQLYMTAYQNTIFYESLPMYAKDERIHAKTGSMRGVSNLSGYLTKENNQVLVFTIMLNGLATKDQMNDLIAKLLVEIAK